VKVLPDGVVVQAEDCGQLGNVDGVPYVEKVAEDIVPRGVA
jgi:hypothetical protein